MATKLELLLEAINEMNEYGIKDTEEMGIMTEGARGQGRKIKKEIGKIENDAFNYLNGMLDKEAGAKKYEEYIKQCDDMMNKVKEIKDDSLIDRILNRWTVYNSVGSETSKVTNYGDGNIGTTNAKTMTADERAQVKAARKDRHFTKRTALIEVQKIRAKITAAFNRYYK